MPGSTAKRLEDATEIGDYEYWLTQEDIADIARIKYQNFRPCNEDNAFKAFEIVGSSEQFRNQVRTFQLRTSGNVELKARLTLILNLMNQHWVTLLITYRDEINSVYFVDSLGNNLPTSYLEILNSFPSRFINLSGYFPKQLDQYNCGLWALENAESLTRMFDEQKGSHWVSKTLQTYRGVHYFSEVRESLSLKLRTDTIRQQRNSHSTSVKVVSKLIPLVNVNVRVDPIPAKRPKLVTNKLEAVQKKLDAFIKIFLQSFAKRLGAYKIIARDERLTVEALSNELKVGFMGGLWGSAIAQSYVGSIPSTVGTVRSLSTKYFVSKKKAQKITRIFSEISNLDQLLVEAGLEIFQSYEQQFAQVTDKAGYDVANEKIADDASGRVLNYLNDNLPETTIITRRLIVQGLIMGKSETFFDPSLKKVRLRYSGNHIQTLEGQSFSTASLFEKVGLIVINHDQHSTIYYNIKPSQGISYGYRKAFDWEVDLQGALLPSEQSRYELASLANLVRYDYQLKVFDQAAQVAEILARISAHKTTPVKRIEPVKNILFNLRYPLKNFSGRTQVLIDLHRLLISNDKPTVITQMRQLSLDESSSRGSLSEGVNAAISGLGGIGKTQLVLEYARLHKSDYDNNVLWIDSEKKVDIVNTFKILATKIGINLSDTYGEKEFSQLIQEVYSYFSSNKSLFIFDNVENPQQITFALPKTLHGTKPTILITSRYTYWQNLANSLTLDTFSVTESQVFIKNELSLTDNSLDAQVDELGRLLQYLPLALQQATAYMQSELILNQDFTIRHYIELFKQKETSAALMEFSISKYQNDPYSKTVMTTWEITLEKIALESSIGRKAIEILYIMAYLYPDRIENKLFRPLVSEAKLGSVLHLLRAYSLITEGSEFHLSTIHRLLQKVLRIKLETSPIFFEFIIKQVVYLTGDFTKNKEIMSHYFCFHLHMLEHENVPKALNLIVNPRTILHVLTYYSKEKILLNDLFDLAQLTLSKEKYLQLIGEAMILYMRYPFIVMLNNLFEYMHNKISEGVLSRSDARFILDLKYTTIVSQYSNLRMSGFRQKRNLQLQAICIAYDFEKKISSEPNLFSCSKRKKGSWRSHVLISVLNLLINEIERNRKLNRTLKRFDLCRI